MKQTKNNNRRQILEARLKSLSEFFFLFAQNDYKACSKEDILNKKIQINLDKRVKEKIDDFYADGEAVIAFRSFLLILGKRNMSWENEPKVTPLYDYDFFIKFVRYIDNREMIEEIQKLGTLFSFSLQRIEKNFYLIRFF